MLNFFNNAVSPLNRLGPMKEPRDRLPKVRRPDVVEFRMIHCRAVYEDEKKLAMGNLSNVECLLCDV